MNTQTTQIAATIPRDWDVVLARPHLETDAGVTLGRLTEVMADVVEDVGAVYCERLLVYTALLLGFGVADVARYIGRTPSAVYAIESRCRLQSGLLDDADQVLQVIRTGGTEITAGRRTKEPSRRRKLA